MAVENIYADSDLEAGKKGNAAKSSGAGVRKFIDTYEVVSGASNASIYMFAKGLNPNIVITDIRLSHDAFGASGVADIGLYKAGTFTAKDDDVFASAIDISSAGLRVDGMENLNIADLTKKLYEHAGDSSPEGSYDLGIILDNVGGTGAGTLTLEVEYIEGN